MLEMFIKKIVDVDGKFVAETITIGASRKQPATRLFFSYTTTPAMPRPAPKRTRQTKVAPASATTDAHNENESTAKSPERGSALDPRALRSQTPLAKNHDQAIDSSPTGDRTGTGSRPGTASRPPTRSRGYSATLSFAGRKGDGNSRIPGTPGYDSSVLSNFRRRPRQQSILQMVQAEDDSSELDDDDFLGGLSPQDESTPLNLSRGKSLLVRTEESPSPSGSPPSSAGSRKRKRPEEIQVPASLPEPSQDIVQDSPNATPVAPPRYNASHMAEDTPQPQFPEVWSQTMAPPASSPVVSTQGSIAGAATEPRVAPRKSSGGKKTKDPAHLSTARLQEQLLPRRRHRRRRDQPTDEYDISSDESDTGMHHAASGDEDELNYQPSRSRRGGSTKPKPLGNAREKSKTNNQKQKKAKTKAKASGSTTDARARRSGGGDKENELVPSSPGSSPLTSPPDSDVSDTETGKQTPRRIVSEELRAAAKKFAEVDQWQLEFEDVSASETQGSPAR